MPVSFALGAPRNQRSIKTLSCAVEGEALLRKMTKPIVHTTQGNQDNFTPQPYLVFTGPLAPLTKPLSSQDRITSGDGRGLRQTLAGVLGDYSPDLIPETGRWGGNSRGVADGCTP